MSIQTQIAKAYAAYELANYGGASVESVSEAFSVYVAAKRAAETDEQKIVRLKHEAKSHDRCAERQLERASECFGKAAFRRTRGDLELAAQFQADADRADACAVAEMAEAMRLRREAALLEARVNQAQELREIV